MNGRESPLFWSFSIGTWFATQVRVSVWMPLVLLVLGFRLQSLELGLLYGGILLFSVLLHEFGHVTAARMSGGYGDEILIWPLGGLAFVQPAHDFTSRFLTPAAGPLVNLMLCGATLPAVLQSPFVGSAFNPLTAPAVELGAHALRDVGVAVFTVNWLLLIANLVPVYPLDGGQMLKAVLDERLARSSAVEWYIRIGCICGVLVMVAGLGFNQIWLVAFGAFVLVMNVMESAQMHTAETYDDSFMGYDFSQGYTSLERSTPEEEIRQPSRRPGFLARLKERRRERREQRQRDEAQLVVQQLDAILEKVHQLGLASLTDAERRLLNKASDRFRNKDKTES